MQAIGSLVIPTGLFGIENAKNEPQKERQQEEK